jgi:phosphoenolpyruvate carboxylase
MLGFSDGTKDGGYLKANWSIFKTKEALTTICKKYDIDVIFFDGRGGPPARGGGKSHRFYAAQSEKIANHEIQLTIQGQTITSRYGTREQFINNCDQLLTAGLSRVLAGKKICLEESDRIMIEEMSEISYKKYLALKDHPLFVPYLENKTPLKYYSEANIGSRPAKRGNKKQLEFKDLRAIPFVGSWSQIKQNVPGYYGLGTALDHFARNGSLQKLQRLFNEVLFFKAMILNSMMSLSKCNFALTAHIGKDPKYGDYWKLIYNEYQLTRKMVLAISGYDILMQEEPVTHHSVEIREETVLPLLLIQQYAMQILENNPGDKEIYEKLITRSLYGIINASRNSI